jgi:hypothetical protein
MLDKTHAFGQSRASSRDAAVRPFIGIIESLEFFSQSAETIWWTRSIQCSDVPIAIRNRQVGRDDDCTTTFARILLACLARRRFGR